MSAFEIGMDEAMEKASGLKDWVKAPGKTYKLLRDATPSIGGAPAEAGMKRGAALLATIKRHKGQAAAAGGLLAAPGVAYGVHRLRREKTAAAGNPAQAVKQSLSTGAPEAQRFAPHLNQGGGMPPAHQAGPVQSQPQPWPGHVNVGNKSPGQQVPGPVARDTSPDMGEKGRADEGTMTRTKSAAFIAGIAAVLDDNDE